MDFLIKDEDYYFIVLVYLEFIDIYCKLECYEVFYMVVDSCIVIVEWVVDNGLGILVRVYVDRGKMVDVDKDFE